LEVAFNGKMKLRDGRIEVINRVFPLKSHKFKEVKALWFSIMNGKKVEAKW